MKVRYQYDRKAPSYCADALAKFGKNPYGENIYRVVWSESQFEDIGGNWAERYLPGQDPGAMVRIGNLVTEENPVMYMNPCYKRVPKIEYVGMKPAFVLEKWLPCGYSEDEWYRTFADPETGLCTLGPYPAKGTWNFCYVIAQQGEAIYPTAAVVEYYARLIEANRLYSDQEKEDMRKEARLKKKRDWERRFDDIYDDAQAAGGTTNLFFATTGRKSKDRQKVEDVPIIDPREQAAAMGLPTTGFGQVAF